MRGLYYLRSTPSSSRGWLHLLVQCIFAIITVASFILIVIMAVRNPNSPVMRPLEPPRCSIHSCMVVCKEAPYFDAHEDDIIFTVSEAETKCRRVSLELQNPSFVNNTLPLNWLSRMRSEIYSLSISRGNLMYIPSGSLISQFTGTIQIFTLESVHIKYWDPSNLVGLSSLRTLNILKSSVENVQANSLRAVDDTLETLSITGSGSWDPINVTGFRGFENLRIVDFSYNDFNEILNRHSFFGLDVTKILYLNFCRITAIGAGAFDQLSSIEVIYLNNNQLVSVPPGLFANIVALENPRPRINLQYNYWHCVCSVDDLMQLVRKEVLLVEARCTYPEEMTSKTFAQFEQYCSNHTEFGPTVNASYAVDSIVDDDFRPDPVFVNGSYCTNSIGRSKIRLMSPLSNNMCASKEINLYNLTQLFDDRFSFNNGSKWIRFSYFLKTDKYSVIQIKTFKKMQGHGLLWFQSSCPSEIYCLDIIPSFLRVYNIDSDAEYSFCPVDLESSIIKNASCVVYKLGINEKEFTHSGGADFPVLIYLLTMFMCLCFGAIFVYGLIRKNPTLLKGSKRILFVKHKTVDALVLPPKVPLRNSLTNVADSRDKDIFTLSMGPKLMLPNLNRMKSVRSDKSGAPSYISAMQPTEDQLAEWRIRHHFNNDLTITSRKSDLSSWIYGDSYYSLDDIDKTYESLK